MRAAYECPFKTEILLGEQAQAAEGARRLKRAGTPTDAADELRVVASRLGYDEYVDLLSDVGLGKVPPS